MTLVGALLAACSSPSAPADQCTGIDAAKPAAGSCPQDLPPDCPDAGVPSYANDIAPIVRERCGSCHAPGGVEQNRPYVDYDRLVMDRARVLTQVYQCKMPPACAPQPSPDERHALLQWIVCKTPDN